MNLDINQKLDELLSMKYETETVEFKESWRPEASLKTITAFANDLDNWGGGYIILGVEEENGMPKYPIKGVKLSEIDNIMKDLLNKCKLISPDYLPIVEPVDYDDHTKLIVIWCPGGVLRPYRSPADFTYDKGTAKPSKDTVYWIRKMASTVRPSEQETTELFSLSNQVPFDDRICHHADITDLNITLIKAYLKEIGSDLVNDVDKMDFNQLCMKMDISNSMPEYMKPKNCLKNFFCLCEKIPQQTHRRLPQRVAFDRRKKHSFRKNTQSIEKKRISSA